MSGEQAGNLRGKDFEIKKGCVVNMMAVDHHNCTMPSLAVWESQLRVYDWGRHVAQISVVNHNLKWLLELGVEGSRRSNTLDYEI